MTIRLSHNMGVELKRAVEEDGLNQSEWVRQAYWAYMKEAHNGR